MKLLPLLLGALMLGCRRSEPRPTAESSAAPSASAAPRGPQSAPGASARPPPTPALAPEALSAGEGVPPQVVPIEPGQTVVLWVRLPKKKNQLEGDDMSHFLGADGAVLASKPGVYIARGAELYRHTTRQKKLPSDPCDPSGMTSGMTEQRLQEASLERTRDGHRTQLIAFDTVEAESEGDPIPAAEQEISPLAFAGSTYFLAEMSASYRCGALHQQQVRRVRAFRIHEDGSSRELDLSPLSSFGAPARQEAMRLFRKNSEKERADDPDADHELEVTAQYPVFVPQGVRWQLQFTGAATWAATDFLTTGYARSVLVQRDQIPTALSDAARLPRPAQLYMAAHPTAQVKGVSAGKISTP